ncbi:hypothetical protein Tco_1345408 [Tanacetum coccineum]
MKVKMVYKGDNVVGALMNTVGIKARRFDGMITIYNGNDEVTYQMVRSHLRFKHYTNEQCNKIPPLLKNREPLSKDILGATTQRDTRSYYPKRYWELLPKEILGAITQRDTGSYYPKRVWDVLWENGDYMLIEQELSLLELEMGRNGVFRIVRLVERCAAFRYTEESKSLELKRGGDRRCLRAACTPHFVGPLTLTDAHNTSVIAGASMSTDDRVPVIPSCFSVYPLVLHLGWQQSFGIHILAFLSAVGAVIITYVTYYIPTGIAMVAAYASRAATLLTTSCFLGTGSLPSGCVDLTGDEDPTNEDRDIGIGDSIGKIVGGAIGTCGGIGERASEAKRSLVKSSEKLGEVFPGEAGK